jgi:hypothetical protein
MAAIDDVQRQRRIDRDHGTGQDVLRARMDAIDGAERALADGEQGAVPAYRQALVDLAAAAAELAEQLPPPSVWAESAASRGSVSSVTLG